jgi:hypothetical protein
MRKGETMIAQPSSAALQNGKARSPRCTLSKTKQVMRVLELTVELLIARTAIGDRWLQGFHDVQELLARAPFSLADIAFANRHLQNAHSYCLREEYGAAAFELRALRGHRLIPSLRSVRLEQRLRRVKPDRIQEIIEAALEG